MPKSMKQTQNQESMTYMWVIVVLMILAGLYFYKTAKLNRLRETQMVGEPMIQDQSELKEEGMQLDETNVDAQIDTGLNQLQEEASEIVK
jgi:hypothetical protein